MTTRCASRIWRVALILVATTATAWFAPVSHAGAAGGSQPLGPQSCRVAKTLIGSKRLSRIITTFKADSATLLDFSMTPIGLGYNVMLLKQKGARVYEKFLWVTEDGNVASSSEGKGIFDYFYGDDQDWMIAKVKFTTGRHTYAYCDYDTLWNLYGGD